MFKSVGEVQTFVYRIESLIRSVVKDNQDITAENRKLLTEYICGILNLELSVTTGVLELRCPECDSRMKERINKQTGEKFYGCSKFPECKGTRDSNGLSKYDRSKQEKVQQDGYSFNRKRNPAYEVSLRS